MPDSNISGYAVRFGDITTIGSDFRERIASGAFTEAIKRNDIVALFGHDSGRVLGRTSNGTLTLQQDQIGLWFSLALDVTTPSGQEALGTVRRQDIKSMSFGGFFTEEVWTDGGNKLPLRTVTKVDLYEISIVAFPAYETTSVTLRGTAHNRAAALRRMRERQARMEQKIRGIQ